jgi:hypothetical protein
MTPHSPKIAILLNGPKACGKDTAARALLDEFGSEGAVFRFTVPVKEETHRRYGLSVAYDHYEDRSVKDSPLPEFGGLSPRQAYIKVGDDLRAEHGPDVVTKMLCEQIDGSRARVVINPDCGGDGEAEGIAEKLGADRVLVFRIHKEGSSYAGDCRNWVTSSKVRKVDIVNIEDQVSDYVETVRHVATMFRDAVAAADVTRAMHAEARGLLEDRPRRFA